MKNQIKSHFEKQLQRFGASAEAPGYAEALEGFVAEAKGLYDEKVAAGVADLDAYRSAVETVMPRLKEAAADLKAPVTEKEPEEAKKPKNDGLASVEEAAHTSFWLITAAAYFIVSFLTHRWGVTWVIWLAGGVGSMVIDAVFDVNRGKPLSKIWSNMEGALWLVVVIVYFTVSFLTHKWGITWIIFLVGALISAVLEAVKKVVVSNEKREEAEESEDKENEEKEND